MRYFSLIFFISFAIAGCGISDHKREKEALEEIFKGHETILPTSGKIPRISPDKSDVITIKIPENVTKTGIDLDRILDSSYYIPLETTKDNLIGNVDKILFSDDRIIIVEQSQRDAAFVFSNKGKFINQIGVKGKGPHEYMGIRDIAIDQKNKEIILMDTRGRKLMYFDMDGNHKRNQKLYFFANNLAALPDHVFLYELSDVNSHITQLSKDLLLFSTEGERITSLSLDYAYRDKFPKNDLNSRYNFSVMSNKVLYTQLFKDTVYEISGLNQIKARYYIDFGRKSICNDINDYNVSAADFVKKISDYEKWHYFDGQAIETDNALYIGFSGGNAFYSKNTGNLSYGNYTRSSSKYGEKQKHLYFVYPVTSKGHFFVGVIWPYRISNARYDEYDERIQELLKGIDQGDNPILYFYSLKDF